VRSEPEFADFLSFGAEVARGASLGFDEI